MESRRCAAGLLLSGSTGPGEGVLLNQPAATYVPSLNEITGGGQHACELDHADGGGGGCLGRVC
jgi:hypothetical protein